MEDVFHSSFVNLFGKPAHRSHTLDLHSLNIPLVNHSLLESDLSKVEVWEAVKSLPSCKVPGPDSYIDIFYQKRWDSIKYDVLAVVNKLGCLDEFNLELLNQAFLTLVPKTPDA